MVLLAGRMRELVEVQKENFDAHGHRSEIQPWTTIATVRAEIRRTTITESLLGETMDAYLTHRVFLHYLPDITSRCRLVRKSNPHTTGSILYVDQAVADSRRRQIELRCIEREEL